MALPNDPAKLAALRARQAQNSANYRARQKALRTGSAIPAALQPKRPANYRPPRVSGIVENAQAAARLQRERRAEVISSLTDIRNPRVQLRPGEVTARMAPERKTRKGQQTQASRIRGRAAAERLQNIGRSRRNQLLSELERDPTGRLFDNMTPDQRRDFQRYSESIAKGSQQSIAILFEYAGGQSVYSAAIERILASPESRDVEEGLAMLATLAEQASKAADMYSPSKIGRLTI
jgi:hypothetical protein